MRQFLAAVGVLAIGVQVDGQRRPLRELVCEYGDCEILEHACGPDTSLSDVVAGSALIVHGVIEGVDSRIARDERALVTDIAIRSFDVSIPTGETDSWSCSY
jgi:hypothetical protein